MKHERNITRIEYKRAHSWWVRLYRKMPGKEDRRCISKHFADNKYGGKRKALAAAIAWRDEMIERLPAPRNHEPITERPYGYVKRQQLWRRKTYSDVFVGWMRRVDGRVKQTSFSIAQWGVRDGRRAANIWLLTNLELDRKNQ